MTALDGYKGARVLVTGSDGFVGRHLCRRLRELGAHVTGFDLIRGFDVCQWEHIDHFVSDGPRYVFHLAAQAFVGRGYEMPRHTFRVNTWGTVNLLDALRQEQHGPCAVVIATTDKVYGQAVAPASEGWPLDGTCPYSASKVMVERVVDCYRRAYFEPEGHRIAIATARAGNILGPGDHFGVGRLLPNAVEALHAGDPVPVYHGDAVRPWQAVWDVVDGYLLLGAALAGPDPAPFAGAFNFGPARHHAVIEVVQEVIRAWGSGEWEPVKRELHEVDELRIDSSKAARLLGWAPRWTFEDAIRTTVETYREELCSDQERISST